MIDNVHPIPEGYHSVTPSITCKEAAKAIDYYKKVFGATEIMSMLGPGGTVMHAELKIGDSVIFVSDEFPGMSSAPVSTSSPSYGLFLYVEDVDGIYNRAVAAGASVVMPITNMFWGDRYGKVVDPFGHHWGLATHVEDVSPEEMKRRQEAWAATNMAKAAGQN